jgi:hypothetical protein
VPASTIDSVIITRTCLMEAKSTGRLVVDTSSAHGQKVMDEGLIQIQRGLGRTDTEQTCAIAKWYKWYTWSYARLLSLFMSSHRAAYHGCISSA